MPPRDPDLDLVKAVRLLAYDAVEKRPSDYILRYIWRWYSERFHVPLPEVEDIPLEDLLQHFFEVRFEQLRDADTDTELDEELVRLRETREERLAREEEERENSLADEDWFKQIQAEAKVHNAKVDQAKRALGVEAPTERPLRPGENPDRPLLQMVAPTMGESLADVTEPKVSSIPQGIKMEFVSEEEMGDLLDNWDILSEPGKPKK